MNIPTVMVELISIEIVTYSIRSYVNLPLLDEWPFTFGGLFEAEALDERAIVLFGWLEPACLTISESYMMRLE